MTFLALLTLSTPAASAADLPEARPADFRAELTNHGGFGPDWALACDPTSCSITRYGGHHAVDRRDRPATTGQLDRLYATVRAADVPGMRAVARTDGETMDGSTSRLTVTAGGHTWTVTVDANHPVDPVHAEGWAAIERSIAGLAADLGLAPTATPVAPPAAPTPASPAP